MTRPSLYLVTCVVMAGLTACKQEQKVEFISYSKVEGMAYIPAGVLSMGGDGKDADRNEFPKHSVEISAFLMDETEVTNLQFSEFVEATSYKTIAERAVDWDEMQKQLPPNTPKPPNSLLAPGSLVFSSTERAVSFNDPSQWWQWVTGAKMIFPDTGPYPNGDLVLSRINMTPTAPPTQGIISKSYWIINNYDTNKTFNNLSSLEFQDIGNMTPYDSASDFQLQERDENADTDSWAPKGIAGSIDFETKSVTTTTNLTVDSFGQFTVLNRKAVGWIGVMSSDWDNPANWGNGVLPTTSSDVIIPRDTPFQPIVNTNTVIRSITLMEGASLGIMNGVTFETN